jgi:hypothetical protein
MFGVVEGVSTFDRMGGMAIAAQTTAGSGRSPPRAGRPTFGEKKKRTHWIVQQRRGIHKGNPDANCAIVCGNAACSPESQFFRTFCVNKIWVSPRPGSGIVRVA